VESLPDPELRCYTSIISIISTSSEVACSVNSVGGFRGCIEDYTAVGLHGPSPAWLIASKLLRTKLWNAFLGKTNYLGFTE
jgi:hypothetical protein